MLSALLCFALPLVRPRGNLESVCCCCLLPSLCTSYLFQEQRRKLHYFHVLPSSSLIVIIIIILVVHHFKPGMTLSCFFIVVNRIRIPPSAKNTSFFCSSFSSLPSMRISLINYPRMQHSKPGMTLLCFLLFVSRIRILTYETLMPFFFLFLSL